MLRITTTALFASIAVGLGLSACSFAPHVTPEELDLGGVWVHEEDGNESSITFGDDGTLVALNVPDVVMEGDADPKLLDWQQTQNLNGCWTLPEDSRTDGGDHWFQVYFLGSEEWLQDDYGGQMRVADLDTIYLHWGKLDIDDREFEFVRDDSATPMPSVTPLPNIATCTGASLR